MQRESAPFTEVLLPERSLGKAVPNEVSIFAVPRLATYLI